MMQSSRVDSPSRIRIVSIGASAFFLAAFASQAWVQTFGAGGIQRKADKTERFVLNIPDAPKRGIIRSADGVVLARDDEQYALNIDFAKVPKSDGFYIDLGEAIGASGEEIRSYAKAGKKVTWPATLKSDAKKRLAEVKKKWRADGVSAASSGNRMYPMGESASAIVGLFGNAATAKGIEKEFSKLIVGKPGKMRGLVDRTGAVLPMRMEERTPRVDGADIELTIDSNLQRVAFESLKRAVEKHRAESGVAIVMNPKTGDILAMANWPTFDPRTGQGPDGEPADVNPAVMSRWEPGSTMKVFTQAKAIDDGVVDSNWHLMCNGVLRKGKSQIQCDLHGGTRAHGAVNMEKAIAASCNVSAATWSLGIGREPYQQFVKDLGLLDRIDVGLPSTTFGTLSDDYAKTRELMSWGFGQSMGIPPLSLGAAFGAFGNEGIWMQPRLVKSIGGKDNPVKEGKKVFSPETTRQVVQNMEAVFESERGTAHSLRIPGYRIAGKTGTAQRIGRGGGQVSNFVGLVPSVKPKAMILVMIDHPTRGGFYGGVVAGPVFTDLARAVIRKYEMKSDSGTQKSMPKPDVEVQVQR
jgi:cell division protein FtsI/penicillin-binding protein 2